MERTTTSVNEKIARIQNLTSQLVARNKMAIMLGMDTYGGNRDLYEALGYPKQLLYQDFFARYKRQDIAKAIIDRPVKATWQGDLELVETEKSELTPFEAAWKELNWRLGLKTRFARVDKLTGIGQYGVLLLGLDDVRSIEDYAKPVSKGIRKLRYVKPFSEDTAKIMNFIDNPKHPKYGGPRIYELQVADSNNQSSLSVQVHYSRVIHIVDDNLESEIYGTPRLEPVYNRLIDIEKIVGGDAEMYWRGARPGYQGKVDKDFTFTPEMQEKLKTDLDEYEHNLRRFIVHEGLTFDPMAPQVGDPTKNFDIQIQSISAETGIPKRVLVGSERGELSSAQDATEWKTYVQSRREDHAEPRIIRPTIDRFIELGILPAPKQYYRVDWLDLFSVSEKERVEIGKSRSNAIREYTTNPMAISIMPPRAFAEFCLGLSTGQIELIDSIIAEGISDEQKDLMEDVQDITAPPTPPAQLTPMKPNPNINPKKKLGLTRTK